MKSEQKILKILTMIEESLKITPEGNLSQITAEEIDKIMKRQDHEQIFKKLENEFHAIEIHTRPNYINELCYRFYVLKDFESVYSIYRKLNDGSVAKIYYNTLTGVGYNNEHRFKFKLNSPEYNIFEELYEEMNSFVPRNKILKVSKYPQERRAKLLSVIEQGGQRKKSNTYVRATYFINDRAKEIRRRAKLTKDNLVLHKSNMILMAQKLDVPPIVP